MPKKRINKSTKIAVRDSVQVNLSRNWKETRKKRENAIFLVFYLRDLCWKFKSCSCIKYSNKGVRLLSGSFPFFKTCSTEIMAED